MAASSPALASSSEVKSSTGFSASFLVSSMKSSSYRTHFDHYHTLDEEDDGWWIDEMKIIETLTDPAAFSIFVQLPMSP